MPVRFGTARIYLRVLVDDNIEENHRLGNEAYLATSIMLFYADLAQVHRPL